jgi:FtsH-binding integral membrane protein
VTPDEPAPAVVRRLAVVTAVSVALAVFAGFVLQGVGLAAAGGADANPIVLLILTPVPAVIAAGTFALVTRWQTGRRGWAMAAVFFGTLAATIVFPFLGVLGLVLTLVASGVIAVAALRLLDPL